MSYELRPLSLAELLDRAFGIYRRYFLLFVGIMAAPSAVMLCISAAMQVLQSQAQAQAAPGAAPDPVLAAGFAVALVGALLLMGILYTVTYAVALGASTFAVAKIYKAEPPTIALSYGALRGKFGRLAWLFVQVSVRLGFTTMIAALAAAFIGGGFMVLSPILGVLTMVAIFVSGLTLFVWLALRYSVSVPPAVLEDATASESIKRSIDLTRGHRWRVLVLFVFTVIVNYAGLMLFQGPFSIAALAAGPETRAGFWLNMSGVVMGSIAAALTSPLMVIAMAVLYYDLRIRKEGLDLQMMIAGLAGDDALPAPPPSPGGGLFLPG